MTNVNEMTREELLALVSKRSGKSARTSEATLKAKYSHLIDGTLAWDEVASKQYVQIKCACGATRKTFTSDLFQIKACDACRTAARKTGKIERRQLERAALARLEELGMVAEGVVVGDFSADTQE